MASLHLLHLVPNPAPSRTALSHSPSHQFPSVSSHRISNGNGSKAFLSKSLSARFALAESDSSKSLGSKPNPQVLLQELAESFDLPPDYLDQLPRDLRLELNDAAFDISKGPVIDECGQELGDTLLNLSRAWEVADTSTSRTLVRSLPKLSNSLTDSAKSAFGKRLVSAGRRFQSMGQYAQGELQEIAKAMITAGKALSSTSASEVMEEKPSTSTRMFKFGELQVAVTAEKANIGAAIGLVFGIISWELAQSLQSIPESSLQYANDNALLLAKSLRGAMLVLFYSSAVLSAFSTVGLVLLGIQLGSNEE